MVIHDDWMIWGYPDFLAALQGDSGGIPHERCESPSSGDWAEKCESVAEK
jgi:hypothetical protein